MTRSALVALILVAMFQAPASAGTGTLGGNGSITIDDKEATSSCSDATVHYAISGVPEDGDWDVHASGGSSMSLTLSGNDTVTSGIDTMQWCPRLDGVGAFTITGTLTIRDGDFNVTALVPVSIPLTVSKQVTAATLDASALVLQRGKTVRLTGCVTSGGSRDRYRPMYVQRRNVADPNWHVLAKVDTDSGGCYRVSDKPTRSRWYRVYAPATDIETSTHSRDYGVIVRKAVL